RAIQHADRRRAARAVAALAPARSRAGARLTVADTRQRVVITGIGALTPIGCGVDGLWSGVLRGQSAVRIVSRFDASPFRSHLAAEIGEDDFDPNSFMEPRRARRLDRFSQLSVAASLQAVAD